MTSLVSACGIECNTCPFYEKNCSGCHAVKGTPFWAMDHLQGKPCPLYDCSVNEKHMSNCGACAELPCRKFHDLKDPSVSEQEHMEGIEKRVKTLRAMS